MATGDAPPTAVSVSRIDAGPARAVAVAGLGNIGSHLPSLLARLDGVARMILVDPDTYEPVNRPSQNVAASEIGRPKAMAQARRVQHINPAIQVVPFRERLEDIPMGLLLDVDLLVTGLDSLRARREANRVAWRTNTTWIDCGVQADGLLCRVSIHEPGPDRPCLECAWDERQASLLEVEYGCLAERGGPAPTQAPACLGALTAATAALECRRLLSDTPAAGTPAQQIVIDTAHHHQMASRLTFNPACRFDHQAIGPVRRLPDDATRWTLTTLLEHLEVERGAGGIQLTLQNKGFARQLTCRACGDIRAIPPTLEHRLGQRRCRRCRHAMAILPFGLIASLRPAELSRTNMRRTLRQFGLVPGDLFDVLCAGSQTRVVIGGPAL